MRELIEKCLEDSINIKKSLILNKDLLDVVLKLADEIVSVFNRNGKIILCGNGGSASDALHFAGEIVGRFQKERRAWPAIVLNADVASLTAIANDYGYDDVFARQAEGHVNDGDLIIGISTSGNSENVFRAIRVAKNRGAVTAALLGKDGGRIGMQVDYPLIVPCMTTARVQECHITLIHIICEIVERKMVGINE